MRNMSHPNHNSAAQAPSCCGTSNAASPIAPPPGSNGRSFRVNGLDCGEEVAILNKVIGPKVGGQEHLAFDVLNGRMMVLDGSKKFSDEQIIKLIGSTGMSGKIWDAESARTDQSRHLKRQKIFTGLSAAFWAAGFVYHLVENGAVGAVTIFSGHGDVAMPTIEISLFVAAIVFGAWLVAPKAWSSARRLSPDMNLLMMVAIAGALGLGEYFEAATVAFFFSLSLTLESWSVGRARNAVAALLNLAPPTARVVRVDGEEVDVPAAQVVVGERFVVRGGDRIALDGDVVSGAGAVDQAPITGESALVAKEPGEPVYAGTINGEGTLIVEATKLASDSVLSKIIRMVDDAHARRAAVEQWVTKFARIYTPIVMALAILIAVVPPLLMGGLWSAWVYNALVLLVIACPCALVISTPVSIVAALASSARNGVLIKGGAFVEAPARLSALAMDKTGTITMGEPEVAALFALGDTSSEDLLCAAAALEARSSHPLARAILARSERDGIRISAAQDTRIAPGRGVEGTLDGQMIWLGSNRFANEKSPDETVPAQVLERIESAGNTAVVVGTADKLLGLIEIRDRIRPDARQIVARLHAQGIKKIVMLTGDNARTANAVAAEVGVDEVHAELLPADKVAAIETLIATHDVVAMIGDGVNDAPAMARSHFAIAMGAMGSDAAIETADIALMNDDISQVPWLVDHSRRTMGIIRQNIGLSLITKAVFIGLTVLGAATMWGAIAADVGVSLIVVANALRLLQAKGSSGSKPAGGSSPQTSELHGAMVHSS